MNDGQMRKINKSIIISWGVIVAILMVTYAIEVIKGEREIDYLMMFALTMLVPMLITVMIYRKNPDREDLGFIVAIGYSVMYGFVMFTGATQMVFSYVLPLLCFLVLYHRPSLIIMTFCITMGINILSMFHQLANHIITSDNTRDVEIRFAVIIVSFAGGYVSTRLYDSIHRENNYYNEELSKKNEEIKGMAIQTIATIANTIDAKDEYTRGHSKRVAEYSVAIAEALGMPSDKIEELRSIALLHDIGKIGVPDSVLNKPGRLTDDEYEIMKEHTVMGAEILKDIGMFHGIDIGAKYHHERYDGNGYPDKLKGEEIPEIARIIAVADAFDAMTSNRVYRKQLDMEFVLGELKKCRGTQFDPKFDDIMIKLFEDKIVVPRASDKDESELSGVSRIWSRVIEKEGEKFKDRSKYDELTGLYGRSFGEKLIREAVENQKGVLMAVDIDHFRRINGEAGFILGDIYLRTVAACLDKVGDNKILARFGGDEFMLFIPELTDKEKISAVAEKILNEVSSENRDIDAEVLLTVSIGIRVCEGMKNVFHDMFLDADRALYLSKRQGGGCYRFYEKNGDDASLDNKDSIDLIKLRDTIRNPEKYDAYISGSPEFQQAYDLINRIIEESDSPIQLILFTVKPNKDINVSLETQNEVMSYIEKAIGKSIKGMDYSLKYSSTQRMVILNNSEIEGAISVSGHIMKEFYKSYDKKQINVSYSMIEIS